MKPKTKATLDTLIANPKTTPTQAYLDNHTTTNRNTAKVEASKLLTKPNVIIYLKKHEQMAKRTIVEIMNSESVKPDTRIKAAQDILDRNIGKAIQRAEVNTTNLNLNVEASKEVGEAFTAFLKQQTTQE